MITVGEWLADRQAGELRRASETRAVEPKVMDLLFLLASKPNTVFSKADILDAIWPGVTVGDDSLTRCVWKLRKALSDDLKSPRYIETISKRGYRLTAETARYDAAAEPARRGNLRLATIALAIAALIAAAFWFWPTTEVSSGPAALTKRADDFYFQFSRADNEAAIELYDRAITDNPDYAPALAGLADALVQRVIRWPNPPNLPDLPHTDLAGAIADGRTTTPEAKAVLQRARQLAERATRIAPDDAATQKALGTVLAAEAEFDAAAAAYRRAVALDANAWGAMIELGDLAEIGGDQRGAIRYFELAYAAMTRVYDAQAPRVRPWYAATGVLIGDRYARIGAVDDAEAWYRRVLSQTPFQPDATSGLAALLMRSGNQAEAARLCQDLQDRTGAKASCASAPIKAP